MNDPNLELLNLIHEHLDPKIRSAITDGAIRHLQNLSLVDLRLIGAGVTDEGLKFLQKMPLETLVVGSTKITDNGLQHLQNLTSLKQLELRFLKGVSPKGIAALHAALPKCKIESDHGTFGPGATAPPLGTPSTPSKKDRFALRLTGLPKGMFAGQKFALSRQLVDADAYTVEAWFTPEGDPPADRTHVHLMGTNSQTGLLYDSAKKRWRFHVRFGEADRECVDIGRSPWVRNQRIHLAGVRDGGQGRLYVNGKLDDVIDNMPKLMLGTGEFQIGGFCSGLLEGMRISKIARYKQEFVPRDRWQADKDTLALYHCDEGQGDKLIDSSGNGHHGKIAGAKWVKIEAPKMPNGIEK